MVCTLIGCVTAVQQEWDFKEEMEEMAREKPPLSEN
jgi:hypothetical protein